MKYHNKKLILVVVGVLFFLQMKSQQKATINHIDEKGRKQGHWVKVDENKKKIYEGNFVDNIPTGKFVYFYDNGKPWSVSFFSNNGTVTHTKMYDAAEILTAEGKYVNQKKDSVWKYYNKQGKLISDENYVNGVKTGIERVYYSSGGIVEEKQWKDGKLNGPRKKYFESGKLRYEGQYIDDKVEGYTKFYYSNGTVYAEGLYVNDLKHGKWKYSKQDGTPDRVEEYINGRLQGEDPNLIPKEQEEKEKEQSKQFETEEPFQEGFAPHH
jgi:antitoxin component YwqK of YwqJK toxin-antitoxin module